MIGLSALLCGEFEIETGPQYRIGIMQVQDATVFRPSELREQIPLNPGEIYDDDTRY